MVLFMIALVSEDHSMVWVGKELKRPSRSSCLLTTPRIIQFLFLLQSGLEHSQGCCRLKFASLLLHPISNYHHA